MPLVAINGSIWDVKPLPVTTTGISVCICEDVTGEWPRVRACVMVQYPTGRALPDSHYKLVCVTASNYRYIQSKLI